MVKNQELRLDRKDVEILNLLRKDARMSLKDVASKVALSIPAVKARIERMRELGVIKGFTAIIDSSRIAERVRAFIICRIAVEQLKVLREGLSPILEVREMHNVVGYYNLVLKTEFRDLGSLTSFIQERLAGVSEVDVLVISETDKEEYGATVMHDDIIRLRCDFCKAPIITRPVIREIDGGRYYFHSSECADAFERRLRGEEKETTWLGVAKKSGRRKNSR